MECRRSHELISAMLDAEASPADEVELDHHLAGCAACRLHLEQASALTRMVRLRAAAAPGAVPDLAERVLDRARPARLGRGGWLRPALVWVAVVLAVQAAPAVVLGEVDGATTHVARHLGAFALALAVGLLYAAWRPHRAFGLLPFAAALVVAMGLGALFDVIADRRSPLSEVVHLTELIGLWLLWMIAGSPGWERVRPPSRRGVPHATS
jgi:predicted anti-sigma-YlaC factor YlaD